MNPTEALKAIKNGDLDIAIPLQAGELVPGKLSAKENTVVRLKLHVQNGVIDFARSQLQIDPGLTGPHGIGLNGVKMLADGRAEVDVPWLPNPIIGNAAPAKLSDFVDSLTTAESLPVRMLGITVENLRRSHEAPGTATAPEDVSRLMSRIDLDGARVSVKNVQFTDGLVPLAGGGRVRVAADTKLNIEGTLSDLCLKGRAVVQELDLDAGGTTLRGARGSADLEVHWAGNPATGGVVSTRISNLSLQADYAVSRRENGDFVELARGKVEHGSLALSQRIGPRGALDGQPTAELKLGRFEGTVNQAQITVPDGDGTATIRLGRTSVKGEVEVSDDRVLVSGDVELEAHVTGFDTTSEKTRLSFSDVHVTGRGQAQFDSSKGLTVDGNVRVKAALDHGTVGAGGLSGELTKSTLDMTTTRVNVSRGGALDLRGKADVNLGFKNTDVGEKGFVLRGGDGTLTGRADVQLSDTAGLHLSNGAMQLKAAVEDGRVALGDAMTMDLKAGTRIEAAVKDLVFNRSGVSLDLARTRIDATLDTGTVTLPNGNKLHFKDGAKLDFMLDRLTLPQKGIPAASGSLELSASVGDEQMDSRSLLNVPGVTLDTAEGVEQAFKLRLGRFSIQRDGRFELSGMRFGLEATVRRLGGVIR